MTTPKDILGQISGGRVLDVATGTGGFIHFLREGLHDYAEIIGVDSNESAATAFGNAFKDQPNIRFEMADAAQLNFDSESFDLVCVSNSLHHFKEPIVMLREMARVLKPGGTFLVAEMYCDHQTETQMTHVLLHHWWAAVDTVNGVTHNETYRREEILAMLESLDLSQIALFDLSETEENPKNPEISAELKPVFERYIQRAEGHSDLQARGAELKQRVEEIGFHGATTLVWIGRK